MTDSDAFKLGTWEARGGEYTRRLVRDLGLTPEQAAGLVGNLGYESGAFQKLQEIAPAITGSRGGFGIAQWTGPRRIAFEKWALAHHLPPASDEANYGYLVEELRNSQANTIVQLKKQTSLSGAVFSVGQTFERPGGTTPTHLPGYDDRLAYAKRALAGVKTEPADQPLTPIAAPETAMRDAVREVQHLLNDAGILTKRDGSRPGLVDGDPGTQTTKALAEWRAAHPAS